MRIKILKKTWKRREHYSKIGESVSRRVSESAIPNFADEVGPIRRRTVVL